MIGGRWLSRAEIDRRLRTIQLPTFTPGEGFDFAPLKSYWSTVVDETVATAERVFGMRFMWAGIQVVGNRYTDATLPPALKRFRDEVTQNYDPGAEAIATAPETRHLRAVFHAERHALIDSLGTSDHYAEGTQRVVQLLAHELGEFRATLPDTQQTRFDTRARVWVRERRAQGYLVHIAGLE